MLFETVSECGRTYLKTEYTGEDDYRLKMLAINNPGNIVPIQLRVEDGKTYVFFNISDYQNMLITDGAYKYRQRDYDEIFDSIERVCVSMEEYLLPFEDIYLGPDNIFKKKGPKHELVFLYLPGSGAAGHTRDLVEFFLDTADYTDEGAVKSVYSLYQKTREKGFDLNALRESIRELSSGEDIFRPVKSEPVRPEREPISPEIVYEANEVTEKVTPKTELYGMVKNVGSYIKNKILKNQAPLKEQAAYTAAAQKEYVSRAEDTFKTELLSATTIRGGIYALRSKSSGMKDILILEYPYFIGKEKADHEIDDASISRYHARIDKDGDAFFITDLNSTNGTFLNRMRLRPFEKTELKEGDSVIFSHCEYEFCFLY